MASQAATINSDGINSDIILNAIDIMRFKGFNIGVNQYIWVQELLINLTAQGQLPENPLDLKPFIGPVICSSPKEQELFDAQWDSHFFTQSPKPLPHKQVHTEIQAIEKQEKKWHSIGSWKKFGKISGVLLVLILCLMTIYTTWRAHEIYVWGFVLFVMVLIGFRRLLIEISMSKYVSWQSTDTPRKIRSLFVKKPSGDPFHNLTMYRLSQIFRKHRLVPSQELNIDATIEKTIQNGGLFSPVYGHIHRSPEYLVLIDRQSLLDHQSYFADALLDTLENQDVYISRFYFDLSPQNCYSDKDRNKPVSINELMMHYPDHRLLIFSNGECLINPLNDKPVDWIDQFNAWKNHALITFADEISRYGGVHPLLSSDFLVLPATVKGLSHFIDYVQSDKPPKPYPIHLPEIPKCLREDRDALIHIHPPDQELQSIAYKAMLTYLGQAGYEWLSACSIYPILEWNLTIYLGIHLIGTNGQSLFNLKTLSALTQLPWFRVGKMPNWLREHLIDNMTLAQEQKVRHLIHQLFITAVHEPINSFELTFAIYDQSMTKRLGKYVLNKLIHTQGPLQDDIFITFMSNPLSVRIPKIAKTYFREKNKQQTTDIVVKLQQGLNAKQGERKKKQKNIKRKTELIEAEREYKGISTNSYRPNSFGSKVHLCCDRMEQINSFFNMIKTSPEDISKAPLFFIIHGNSEQCHDSLIERFQHELMQINPNVPVAPSLVYSNLPLPKHKFIREALIRELYMRLFNEINFENFDLKNLDLKMMIQKLSNRFSVEETIMIYHVIYASSWDSKFISWYINDFWKIDNNLFIKAPRIITFFNVIYPSKKAKGFKAFQNRFLIKRVKKEIHNIDPKKCVVLPELQPVIRKDVDFWFLKYMPNINRREREKIIYKEFEDSEFLDMNKVESILHQYVKKYSRNSNDFVRKNIYISYHSRDRYYLNQLKSVLDILKHKNIYYWCDTYIEVGEKWEQKIHTEIKKADMAICLVTPNFFQSQYIQNVEIPNILYRKDEGLIIFPILFENCRWINFDWLNKIPMFPNDAKPMTDFTKKEQHELLKELAIKVERALGVH